VHPINFENAVRLRCGIVINSREIVAAPGLVVVSSATGCEAKANPNPGYLVGLMGCRRSEGFNRVIAHDSTLSAPDL
jgi:hypothetical protein